MACKSPSLAGRGRFADFAKIIFEAKVVYQESRQKTKRDGGKTPYYSDLRIHTFRKLLLLLVCIIFIVVPVIILSLYPNGIHRLVIFVIFIVTFVCFFLFLDASDLEVYGVSAGYAAVLSAVFVATNDVLNSSSSQPLWMLSALQNECA